MITQRASLAKNKETRTKIEKKHKENERKGENLEGIRIENLNQ